MNTPLPTLKDSGKRQDFTTGSLRDSREGKGRFDLLPPRALRRIARHFEAGAVKYGDRNWEKGQPISRFLDSALRHALTFLQGERDEDHAAAAAWNMLCLLETEERIRAGLLPQELEDLPLMGLPEPEGPAVLSCECEIYQVCPICDPVAYAKELERRKQAVTP